MGGFKVLIADDLRSERFQVDSLLRKIDPNIERIKVANPAQAKLFLDDHRNEACSLCVISDRDMSGPKYQDTYHKKPDPNDPNLEKKYFPDLEEFLHGWHKETGNDVFIVRRSTDDPWSSYLHKLKEWGVNNFSRPFLLSKLDRMQPEFFRAIYEHCQNFLKKEQQV